jgi:hypothetical protein
MLKGFFPLRDRAPGSSRASAAVRPMKKSKNLRALTFVALAPGSIRPPPLRRKRKQPLIASARGALFDD